MIVKTTKTSNNIYRIDYFNEDMKLIHTIELDLESESISSCNKYNSNVKKPCGQKVANCLDDVYSNHGWISVWAFVQTAFIPPTGVALAVACAVEKCITN